MPIIKANFTRVEALRLSLFKECTPKILVVTDNLNYSPGDAFGLTEFVDTLRASTIHSMTPIVTTAEFDPNPAALLAYDPVARHVTNYKFTDSTHGVLKSRYDVVFLLSINTQFSPKLTDEAGALDAVTAFMQAGGGIFATGDHEDLGAGMCMDIPRVRAMRRWTTGVPSAGGTDRLTTNLPGRGDQLGSNDVYEFDDQSDRFPQRLFVNFHTQAGGATGTPFQNYAHPLLQIPGSVRAIEVFPDHPHEGECLVPSSLTTTLPGGADEWPLESGGASRVSPEMVALTMSHGNGLSDSGKEPVVPRSFIAISAYDGQRAGVGRVATDATWHHFVNVNVKPGLADLAGRDLSDIKQYYTNLATWLMPKNVRRCLRFPLVLQELVRYPLFEDFPPLPLEKLDGQTARELGLRVESALLTRRTRSEVDALAGDALEEALGPAAKQKLDALGCEFGTISARDASLAALGSLTLAIAERFNALKVPSEGDGEKEFAGLEKASSKGVKLYLSSARSKLSKLGELIDAVTG